MQFGFLRRTFGLMLAIAGVYEGFMADAQAELKAGVACVSITPLEAGLPTQLGGYGDRNGRPAEGVHDTINAKAIVFDMDGLLFDTERLYEKAFFAASSELGHAADHETFCLLIGTPWPTGRAILLEKYGPSYPVDEITEVWVGHFRRLIEGGLPLALPDHGQDIQRLGSALTYMRRYLLTMMLGIVADDEDDDGIAAMPQRGAR